MRTREHGRYARTVNLAQQIAAMERDLVRQRAMAERMGCQSLLEGFIEELTELKERWATLQAAPAPQETRPAKPTVPTVKTGQ